MTTPTKAPAGRATLPLTVYVLGLGIFAMVTSELQVSGLMPVMAQGLGVPIPRIGYLISYYAFAMAVGGPVLALLLLRLRHKTSLMVLFLTFVIGEALAATASGYPVMILARIITGAVSGAFFGVALAVCVEVVDERLRGRATSIVLGGLMVGTVLGLPGANLIGQHWGWRASFWAVTVLTALVGLVTAATVPMLERQESRSLREETAELKRPRLWAVFSTSTLVIGATYAAFSYFTPILKQVTGFGDAVVPLLLIAYGVATLIGNNIVGRLADRYTIPVLAVGLVSLTVFLTVFGLFADARIPAVVALLGTGLVGVTMNPALVTRVMRTANGRPLVNTVHTSMITMGVVLGSWAGGLGISTGFGLRAPLWVGVGLAVLGILSLVPDFVADVRVRRSADTLHAATP
ncbi:MFS transporter [Streptomyces sp. CA-132043]|uniref:MFS transporter n=1 Tax=Streptomyces sp. CA-132043 TaxID=3240048 RepID=UPI003D8BA6F9